jgi:hypothetical protein
MRRGGNPEARDQLSFRVLNATAAFYETHTSIYSRIDALSLPVFFYICHNLPPPAIIFLPPLHNTCRSTCVPSFRSHTTGAIALTSIQTKKHVAAIHVLTHTTPSLALIFVKAPVAVVTYAPLPTGSSNAGCIPLATARNCAKKDVHALVPSVFSRILWTNCENRKRPSLVAHMQPPPRNRACPSPSITTVSIDLWRMVESTLLPRCKASPPAVPLLQDQPFTVVTCFPGVPRPDLRLLVLSMLRAFVAPSAAILRLSPPRT